MGGDLSLAIDTGGLRFSLPRQVGKRVVGERALMGHRELRAEGVAWMGGYRRPPFQEEESPTLDFRRASGEASSSLQEFSTKVSLLFDSIIFHTHRPMIVEVVVQY